MASVVTWDNELRRGSRHYGPGPGARLPHGAVKCLDRMAKKAGKRSYPSFSTVSQAIAGEEERGISGDVKFAGYVSGMPFQQRGSASDRLLHSRHEREISRSDARS